MRLPSSIFVSVSLFTAETTAALYLSSTYRSAGDQIWQGLTLLFTLVPSVLVQLTLTFIHRDLSRDRPLVLLLHILQLGPIVRSVLTCLRLSTHRRSPGYHCAAKSPAYPRLLFYRCAVFTSGFYHKTPGLLAGVVDVIAHMLLFLFSLALCVCVSLEGCI